MIDEKTIVKVIGLPDMADYIIDFEEFCALEDSYNVIMKEWNKLDKKERRCYGFSVCLGAECIYNFYNGRVNVQPDYEGIINFGDS